EGPADRRGNYRVRWIRMNVSDALFESQSGFSTTGATVIAELEDPLSTPRCILFWRSSTHFLGGLGIIVLFVAILGQGSAGKALMRSEMPGPSKEGSQTRMQHTAWTFAVIYAALNGVLTLLLMLEGMTLMDALCHAFGTMATGGFSTYNASLGHFQSIAGVNSALVEYTVLAFMVVAGMNFTLLYFVVLRQAHRVWADAEWRAYLIVLLAASLLVVGYGMWHGDFDDPWQGLRFGSFQVVSIMTTTGFGTHDFDAWNSLSRGLLFLLMFVGGCAGSTGGGLKVIRHILFHKILWLEVEHSFRPHVVRPLRLAGRPVDDPDLRHNILVYFGIILFLFIASWMIILTCEPDRTWGGADAAEHKLIDTASAVAATMNNIGPGLGVVGATQNYTHFSSPAKLLFTVLMMIGRLEIFPIIVLFMPSFWRSR
ncbi:MAG: TrkH family potassium uptake protein, partial [Planctomycetales bacterium]|nr:TrkH family potassium uptake protein [Planctomycetales bacterium]